MPDIFVMLTEGRFEVPVDDDMVMYSERGDLLIYVDGKLRIRLGECWCAIEGAIPDTLALAAIGRRLSAIVDPEILAWCPGAVDAVVIDVLDRTPPPEDAGWAYAAVTILNITPIDVRQAKVHHVAWPTFDPADSAEKRLSAAMAAAKRPRPIVRYDRCHRIRPPHRRAAGA